MEEEEGAEEVGDEATEVGMVTTGEEEVTLHTIVVVLNIA